MKTTFLILMTTALASRLITFNDATTSQNHHAVRRSLNNLRTNIFRAVQDRIDRFNSSNHGHKREINFDPAALGCTVSHRNQLVCSQAKVSNHFQSGKPLSAGVVITPYDES